MLQLINILHLGLINEFNLNKFLVYNEQCQWTWFSSSHTGSTFADTQVSAPHYHVQMKVRQPGHLARASLRVAQPCQGKLFSGGEE